MEYMIVLVLFSVYTMDIQATTHWMVTETGLIQPKIDSPFEMIRPYDLLAFLNQDTRWDNIINLYYDLYHRHFKIKKLWYEIERDSDITIHLNRDQNCIKAGSLNRIDWYRSHLEDGILKGVPEEEFLLETPAEGQDKDIPDCKKISSLTFSMFAFDHLEGMINRENLTAKAELALPEQISPIMTIEQFGHWIASVLRKNSSSWLHYNMASLYWRVRGNVAKGLECCRRAVHYAPREYKDIPLLSMGTIFHRSKMSEDAVTVLGAAVDHDPQYPINHFVLANAYAVLGDFNSSLKHFDECLKLMPGFEIAIMHKHGVLCHAFLLKKIKAVQKKLVKLQDQLLEYSSREVHWLKSQAAFLRTMKHAEELDYKNIEKICEKMSDVTGLNIKDLKKEGDKNSLIQYFLDGPMYNNKWLNEKGVHALESAYNLQRLVRHIEKHVDMASNYEVQTKELKRTNGKIIKEIGPMPVFPDFTRGKLTLVEDFKIESQPVINDKLKISSHAESEFEKGPVLYPLTMKIDRNKEDFDTARDWPTNRLCQEDSPSFPENVEAIFPVFMPFENKGLRLKALLTDKIGVPAHKEHDLPWHPPICPSDGSSLKKFQKKELISEVAVTDYLRQKLMEYVGDGSMESVQHMQDAEIGQRIHTAMRMSVAPKWILYTLSSLYWRVRGNNANALNCLLSATKVVKSRFKDLVLASLASVYLEMGYFDEALAAAEEAFRLSLYEPATNFILAELNMVKKHRNTQMFHLKQVVRVEPNFMNGLARNLLNGWACILKQVNKLQELDVVEGNACTQVDPEMNMVCEKDGTNCHVANIQCFTGSERESSAIVRLLEDATDSVEHSAEYLDASIFEPFISKMPQERSDRAGHYDNFQTMMKIVEKLGGCGLRGCSSIQPQDLALKEKDCSYQSLQLGYWLHIITFRQLLTDNDLSLPPEIPAITPSNKKVPECRLGSNTDDFLLDRLIRVDVEGWEPILSVMHQFAEMFDIFDYTTLGAKMAKYIELRPRSWVGALGAGWWCGAGGHGACALRCLSAAYAHAPPAYAAHALRALAALLHMQSKPQDAKDVAYLSFYLSPKSKIEAFLVAVSHTYLGEYEQAVWMYRYALTFDPKFLPAKACLHATMCMMLFAESSKEPKG